MTHILKEQKMGFILTIHVKVIWPTFIVCPSPEKYQNLGFWYLFPNKNRTHAWGENRLMHNQRVASGDLETGLKVCGTAGSGGARELRRWLKFRNFTKFSEFLSFFLENEWFFIKFYWTYLLKGHLGSFGVTAAIFLKTRQNCEKLYKNW